ncbi:PepSY domain-containing protein [Sulfurivermis fontis]|uniref:PepSY domain-containing protein n=1 Tax=Sulfurivermis fontis TaxID=1972068 RepID=UPI000FD7F379|nr:PepSY domain-containing protein [Sulfurivermis fontis]
MGRLTAVAFLLAALLAAAGGASAESDHDRARRLRDAGDILPLETIIERVRRERPGRILELELKEKKERILYEVEMVDERGMVWELYFDARSGELLKSEQDD